MMVSVCMAVYNGEKFVRDQCLSILKQLSSDDELIISDDNSTDATLEIINEINDPRIRTLKNTKGKGTVANFQNACSEARGAYIFLSDQDDIWLEHKYSTMLELLKKYDLVTSDAEIVDEYLQPIAPSLFEYLNSGKGLIKNMLKSTYYGSCMAFSRTTLNVAMPFPDTQEIGHDLWLGLVAELTGKVYFHNEPLIKYRRHSAAFTAVGLGKSKRSFTAKLAGRIIMLKEILKFYTKYKLCKKA